MPSKIKTSPNQAPPDVGLALSKKGVVILWLTCLCLAVGGISAYLLYKELHKTEVGDYPLALKNPAAGYKNYSNDYWGFRFQYPNDWWPALGSFEDGEYFFASEPVDFAKELEAGQSMLEVKTYNNWKHLSFADWLSDLQNNYLAQGVIEQQNLEEFKGVPAIAYNISLKKPVNSTSFWKVLAVSKNQDVKYLFILESDSRATAEKYDPQFRAILNSLEFYPGFGVN